MPFMYALVPLAGKTWTGTLLRAFETPAPSAGTPVGYKGVEAYGLKQCNQTGVWAKSGLGVCDSNAHGTTTRTDIGGGRPIRECARETGFAMWDSATKLARMRLPAN